MTNITVTDPVAGTGITAGLHATNNASLRAAINGGIDAGNFGAGKIFAPSKLTQEAATLSQAILWNGTNWAPSDVPRIYDRATTTVDVQTSAAETSIYTKAIAGNDMGTARMLRLTLLGDYLHNNVAGDTLTLKLKLGGTTFYNNAANLGNVTGAARHPWHMYLHVANLGAANSQMILGQIGMGEIANQSAPTTGAGQGLTTLQGMGSDIGISTLGTIDTTASQTLDVTVQWSASSANNSWRQRYAVLELV